MKKSLSCKCDKNAETISGTVKRKHFSRKESDPEVLKAFQRMHQKFGDIDTEEEKQKQIWHLLYYTPKEAKIRIRELESGPDGYWDYSGPQPVFISREEMILDVRNRTRS